MTKKPLRIASVNVNGVRAAFRNGMDEWLANRELDILCLQEVRATDEDLAKLFGESWHILHDPASAKGRAGVAVISRQAATTHRTTLGPTNLDSTGRWLEADFEINGKTLTVVSVYVHSGDVNTPKQIEKYKFLTAMDKRLPALTKGNALAVFMGDLNVGHRTLDIKNWKGNLKNAGFLPEERAHFDRWLGAEGTPKYNSGHNGWIDLGRRDAGEEPGVYTWWSQRGQAFDTNTGWRIDYQIATPALAEKVVRYTVDRASAYNTRWSDHAPVVVDYNLN